MADSRGVLWWREEFDGYEWERSWTDFGDWWSVKSWRWHQWLAKPKTRRAKARTILDGRQEFRLATLEHQMSQIGVTLGQLVERDRQPPISNEAFAAAMNDYDPVTKVSGLDKGKAAVLADALNAGVAVDTSEPVGSPLLPTPARSNAKPYVKKEQA